MPLKRDAIWDVTSYIVSYALVVGLLFGLVKVVDYLRPNTVTAQEKRSRFAEYPVYQDLRYIWDKDRNRCFAVWLSEQRSHYYWGETGFVYIPDATEQTCR